jgi:3-hydroxyacyl-CoA dehydrogenase / enoyl-CoA hydratase / 3-hydroxybutyryl-CoA epimerase
MAADKTSHPRPVQGSVREGLGFITWLDHDHPLNVISEAALQGLEAALEQLLGDEAVRGIVIHSGRQEFVVGADISTLVKLRELPAGEAFAQTQRLSLLLRRMETQGKPVVAAITGDALGGGLEIALACHRRIVADLPRLKLGFPEVMLGLLPGAGGTQRMPRLIGVAESLKLISTGQSLNPAKALKLGLIDELAPPDEVLHRAKAWLQGFSGKAAQAWDKPGYALPQMRYLDDAWMQTFGAGNSLLRQQTQGNYPAPQAIFACVYQGVQIAMDAALKFEGRQFVKLLHGPVSRAMTRTLWFGRHRANKLDKRPAGIAPTAFTKVGVLGAGLMGAGIAIVTAEAGIDCVLLDVSDEAAARGKAHAAAYWQRQVGKGRLTADKREALLARIHAGADYAALQGAQLVIEAVFEDRALKAEVTRRAEAVLGPHTVLGSNTSTLPIGGLAQASARAAQFIGIHFFSPVEKMPLVEIIRGQATGDAATALAMDYVAAIRKTPIVVNDARGFYTSRVFGTYMREAFEMLHEGLPPVVIERAGQLTGMPMGPFELADMVGLDTVQKIYRATAQEVGWEVLKAQGDNPQNLALMDWLVAEHGRPGQKAGQGFYDCDATKKPKAFWPVFLERYASATRGTSAAATDVAALQRRFLHIQALEAVRCLDENVVTAADDADLGSILGWGFAPWTGGVLSYIDGLGAARFVADCDALAARHGGRYVVPDRLRRMALQGEKFYPVEPA